MQHPKPDVEGMGPLADRPAPGPPIRSERAVACFIGVELQPRPSVAYVSGGCVELTGYDRLSMPRDPRHLFRLVERADRPRVLAYLRDLGHWRERIEFRVKRADESSISIEAWFAPYRDAAGVPVGIEIAARQVDGV